MTTNKKLQAIDYQRTPMRLLNGALRGAGALGIARFDLNPSALIAAAKKKTGLTDFGGDSFLEPMKLLVQSLENEADLNPLGRFMSKSSILRLLTDRLYAQDLVKRHPEILARSMPDPVAIVGLARSGTTRLQRLMASDSNFLHIKSWESVYPVPYPECFTARARWEN